MSSNSLVSLVAIKMLVRLALLVMTVVGLTGCGSSEADSGTQAAAEAGADGGVFLGTDYPDGDSMAANASAGGGAYGGGANQGQQGGGYGGDVNAIPGEGYGEGMMPPDPGMPGDLSYDAGYAASMGSGGAMPGDVGYAGGAYATGMEGYPGMEGYGGASADPQFGMMVQFVQQNCVQCHGQQSAKGDVRLHRLTSNFEDQNNAAAWSSVLEQVESGQMPPKAIPRRPDPRQKQALVAWIKKSLKGADFVPLEDRDYLSQAEFAFASGKERDAINLAYAHAIAADDEAAKELLSQAKWSTVGLRPVLALRFAVGVILTASDDLQDLRPIGSGQSDGSGGGEFAGGSFGGGGATKKGGTERTFQQLTGAFGEALVTQFENRWTSGSLGSVFKDVEESQPTTDAAGGAGFNPGYAGGAYSGSGYEGVGMPGDVGGMPGEFGGDATQAQRAPVKPGSQITQGLLFIGTGNQAELLAKASELGVDGLFVFDVKAEQNRRRQTVENDTRLRLVTIDGKALAATSTLNNIEIQRNRMRGVDEDLLDKNIERCFAMFDEKVRLDNMPALKPEHAQSRMRQLIVDKKSSNLTKLFEARLYHSLGLLNNDELSMLYQIVLRGNEGIALASGTVDDRRLVLGEILTN